MSQYKTAPRVDPRVDARIPAVLYPAAAAAAIPAETENLSAGGALCRSDAAIDVGGTVKIRLDLTDVSGAPQPVVLEAIVLRVTGAGPFLVALHFVEVPPRIVDLLKRYIIRAKGAP